MMEPVEHFDTHAKPLNKGRSNCKLFFFREDILHLEDYRRLVLPVLANTIHQWLFGYVGYFILQESPTTDQQLVN